MNVEIYRTDDMPPALRDDLAVWDSRIFQEEGDLWNWETTREWTVVVFEGDIWTSALQLLFRTIRVGEYPLTVGGVGGVMTKPDFRRQGYAAAAMHKSAEFLCGKAAFGLLVCAPEMTHYYAGLGWQQVNNVVTFDQLDGQKHAFPPTTGVLIYSCSGEVWPEGDIDLAGLPW